MMRTLRSVRLWTEAWMAARTPAAYRRVLRLWGRSNGIKLLIAGLVRRGDVVFDVGANRGIFTALMSNLVGPDGRVHAFEPSPDTCLLLEATLAERARDPSNVTINTSAVGTRDGVATLYTPQRDHGQASLQPHDAGSWSGAATVQSAEVRVTALDSYAAAGALPRVDVIKMDIEGAELPALRGFAAGLRSVHPIIVCELCEEWTRAFGYRPSDVVTELKQSGYDTFYLVSDRGDLDPLVAIESVDDGESRDLVAVVSSAHAGRVARLVR